MTLEQINQAYAQVAAEAGQLQFNIERNKVKLANLNNQMLQYVAQAEELKKAEKIAADAIAKATATTETKPEVN